MDKHLIVLGLFNWKRRHHGEDRKVFSLIELLIVVAVIGIIAAIAVPNLMQSKLAANEASAIASVRTIVTAQITFSATQGNGAYAANLAALNGAGLLDAVLGGGAKDGYAFASGGNGNIGFTVTATPTAPGVTGNRVFTADQTAVISADGTPLGQ